MKIVVSAQLMQIANGFSPFSHGTPPRSSACVDACGLLPAWPRASPAMVHGEITVAANPLRTMRDSVPPAWLFTVWCGLLSVPAGRSGRIVCRPSPSATPRQAASAVRRAFQGTNRDVSSQVRWPASSHPLPVEESLAHWRDASHDEDFFRFIGRRFAEISSSCRSTGIFDALFTHSELRRALSHCIDSAVGLDGLLTLCSR